jgi:hypothetical protein
VIGEAVGLVVRGVWLARFFDGLSIFGHLLRAFTPTVAAVASVLALRAALGVEQTLLAAIGMFALYVAATVVVTIATERPLLREAAGYLFRRSRQPDAQLAAAAD